MHALDRAKVRELLELTGGDTTWLDDLYATYVDDTRARLADLRKAVEDGDADRVQRAAHGIKGGSANIGAQRVADACNALETSGRAGDLSTAGAQLTRLEDEFHLVIADIPSALGRG